MIEVVLLIIVLMLTSCSSDTTPVAGAGHAAPLAIGFDASADDAPTRAANAIGASGALASAGGFGVFACNTGLHRYGDVSVSSNFMYNQQVASTDAGLSWRYEPVKYWPNGEDDGSGATARHRVSFFAYAPYSDLSGASAASYCISAFHLQHEQTNPWLTYRLHPDVAQQVDLLYALPQTDRQRPDVATPVALTFRHALSCVGDKVTVDLTDALRTHYHDMVTGTRTQVAVRLTAVSITYTLTERGRLVLWTADGDPNWQTISSGNATTERTVSLTDGLPHTLYSYNGSAEGGTAWQAEGHGVYYLPIEVEGHPQTAAITVGYDVVTTIAGETSAESRTTSGVLTLSAVSEGYQAGKNLNIDINIFSEE